MSLIMSALQMLPGELINLIIEQLTSMIGIYKIVSLRTVSKGFNAAIIHAVCVTQIVDIYRRETQDMEERIAQPFKGLIFLNKSRSITASVTPDISQESDSESDSVDSDESGDTSSTKSSDCIPYYSNYGLPRKPKYLLAIVQVNDGLDALIHDVDEEAKRARHEAVAAAVIPKRSDDSMSYQETSHNLFCGAIIAGDLAVIESLLSEDIIKRLARDDDEHFSLFFDHPLLLAARHGPLQVVRLLSRYGASLQTSRQSPCDGVRNLGRWNYSSQEQRWRELSWRTATTLRVAIESGQDEIVEFLLLPENQSPLDSPEYLSAALEYIKAGRHEEVCSIFEILGREFSYYWGLGDIMLVMAARYNRPGTVQWLHDAGVDVNAINATSTRENEQSYPLYEAVSGGHLKVIKLLLKLGAKFDIGPAKRGFNPLGEMVDIAAHKGHEDVVELLLEHGASVKIAILAAAKVGQMRIVKHLIETDMRRTKRKKFSWRRDFVWDAFMAACDARHWGCMSLFIDNGLSLNSRRGRYLMRIVCYEGIHWLHRYLIRSGVVTDERCRRPWDIPPTVRHVCVYEDTWEWVSKY